MSRQQHYSDEEAEEILRRSIARQAQQGGFLSEHAAADAQARPGVTPERLQQMAAELGVSPATLQQAEADFRQQRATEEEHRAFRQHRRDEWIEHLVTYVVVNAFLLALNWYRQHAITWALFPLLGWGIGVALNTLEQFQTSGDDYEKEFLKWRKKRRRRMKQMTDDDS